MVRSVDRLRDREPGYPTILKSRPHFDGGVDLQRMRVGEAADPAPETGGCQRSDRPGARRSRNTHACAACGTDGECSG